MRHLRFGSSVKKCVARVVDRVVDLLLRGKRYLRDLKFFTDSARQPEVALSVHSIAAAKRLDLSIPQTKKSRALACTKWPGAKTVVQTCNFETQWDILILQSFRKYCSQLFKAEEPGVAL